MLVRYFAICIASTTLFSSCLDRNEKGAAEAIAGLVNARECRVIHAVSFETIQGVKQDRKNLVVLKIEGVAQFDSIQRKDLITSIAALRYYQWQDAGLLDDLDRVEVDVNGKGGFFKSSYTMEELSEAATLELKVDECLQLVRDRGYLGLAYAMDTAYSANSSLTDFSNGLHRMDSLYGSVDVAKVLGFRIVEGDDASMRLLAFGVYVGNGQDGGEYLDLAVNPINQRIVAIDTFEPW